MAAIGGARQMQRIRRRKLQQRIASEVRRNKSSPFFVAHLADQGHSVPAQARASLTAFAHPFPVFVVDRRARRRLSGGRQRHDGPARDDLAGQRFVDEAL